MSIFDFTLKHVPETKIGKVDRLSRRPDWKIGVEKNNENQTLIKEKWICSLAEVVIKRPKVDILEKIKIAKGKNEEVVEIVEEMKKIEVKVLREDKCQIERNLVLKKEKVYMPKNKKLRIEIILLYYDILVAKYKER